MKICMLPCYFYPVIGGAETHVFHLSKKLVEMGNEVFVLTANANMLDERNVFPNEEVIDGLHVRRFKFIDLGAGLRIWKGFINEILEINPDIIHAHSIGFPHSDICAIIGKIKKIPSIVTTHGALGIGDNVHKENVKRIIWAKMITKQVLRFFDRIIAISQAEILWLLKNGVSAKKIHVIPNGIPEEILDCAVDPKPFKEKYGLSSTILYLGRLASKKGIEHLISATPLILNEHNVKILIVGPSGGAKKELVQLSSKLGLDGHVIFTGELSEEDKLQAIVASDMLILPSAKEAQGIVLLEAQAMGKPVIATNQGGIPHFIKDGENGILIDYGRPDQIAEAVKKLLKDNNLSMRIGKCGKESVKKFTWGNIARKTIDVYSQVLAK